MKYFSSKKFFYVYLVIGIIFVLFLLRVSMSSSNNDIEKITFSDYSLKLIDTLNDSQLGVVHKYQIIDSQMNPIVYRQFFEELNYQNYLLIDKLSAEISNIYDAAFWECKPFRFSTIGSSVVEFVIIKSLELGQRHADPEAFRDQFHQLHGDILSFENLGKDASLVVPRPVPSSGSTIQYGTHLASFLRGATTTQKLLLWQKVGEVALAITSDPSDRPYWLSTSGLGISWLHIRFDKKPKYYNWKEYKHYEF